MKKLLFVIVLLLTACGNAWADAAPDPLRKGISPVRKSSRVMMLSERVEITLGAERCGFWAHFVLKNPTDVAEILEVGFPASYPNEILDPMVEVDEHGVTTERSIETTFERFDFEGQEEVKEFDTHWLLWKMQFEPGQTRTVDMRYWVRPWDHEDYVSTAYTSHRFDIREEFRTKTKPPAVKRVLSAVRSFATGYVLRTGTGWDGPIGRAEIIVRHPAYGAGALRRIAPDRDYEIRDNALVWTFENFEPDFDIGIEFNNEMELEQEVELARQAVKAAPHSQALLSYERYLKDLKEGLLSP